MGRPRDVGKRRFWGAQLRAWQQSGLTQAEFCRRQGLNRHRFHCWKDEGNLLISGPSVINLPTDELLRLALSEGPFLGRQRGDSR